MSLTSVVYHSATGHTQILANAVLRGIASLEGARGQIFEITGGDIVEGRWDNPAILAALDESDAIIFGAPTYMGSVSGQMKSTRRVVRALRDDRIQVSELEAASK